MHTFGKPRIVAIVVVLAVLAMVCWPGGDDPNSPDPQERLRAINELAGSTDGESVSTLVSLSGDPKQHVAIAAVKAIGATPKTSHAPLRKILTGTSNSPPVRAEAVAALGKCPKANVEVAVLTKVLTGDPDPQVRAGAARGLARRRDKVAIRELVAALEDPDARVRLWAITAIGRTTALRFEYDAWAMPENQRKQIAVIKDTLRRRTSYR
ncbi:MAG: HEAT repeat domain-containing protein [bacterium]|nr:HEAT repeat domain-containing protein [bacterium]